MTFQNNPEVDELIPNAIADAPKRLADSTHPVPERNIPLERDPKYLSQPQAVKTKAAPT